MEINREVDLADKTFIYTQKTDESTKELKFNYERCNGCAICVYACPVRAIELGPVKEIATGLDAPPVIIDHIKCTYCGICAALCPFKCFDFRENGKDVEFPISLTEHAEIIQDRCTGCKLCEEVCPTGAIKREINIRREDFPEKNEGIIGEVKIDDEKCNLCGICADFCPAFILIEKEVSPDSIMPFEQLLFDRSQCDYCRLCEEVCPEKAITVDGKRIKGDLPEKFANVRIELEECSHCDYCRLICPYEAVENSKTGEGEIILFEERLDRCDPVGCAACIKICKNNRVWYVSRESGKIAYNDDFCVYCGACEYACPHDLIDVQKEKLFTKELPRIPQPWRESWERAVERAIDEKMAPVNMRVVKTEREITPVSTENAEEIIHPDPEILESLSIKFDRVLENLNKPGVRLLVEKQKKTALKKLLEDPNARRKNKK